MSPDIRFVLISWARSGTTLAIDLIRQHPEVYAHCEVFIRDGVETWQFDAQFLDQVGLEGRLDDPAGFARRVLDFTPGPRCVGFKMWQRQAPEACAALLADPGIHKILHLRENILASYSSDALAKTTGVSQIRDAASAHRAATTQRPKLGFDADAFRKIVRRRKRGWARLRKAAVGPVCLSTYRAVVTQGVGPLYDFLGLAPFAPVERLQKVNTHRVIDRFDPACHADIAATLDELGHPEWIEDG
jgi:hypothetical protein